MLKLQDKKTRNPRFFILHEVLGIIDETTEENMMMLLKKRNI